MTVNEGRDLVLLGHPVIDSDYVEENGKDDDDDDDDDDDGDDDEDDELMPWAHSIIKPLKKVLWSHLLIIVCLMPLFMYVTSYVISPITFMRDVKE